jgi:hypothetical protein
VAADQGFAAANNAAFSLVGNDGWTGAASSASWFTNEVLLLSRAAHEISEQVEVPADRG